MCMYMYVHEPCMFCFYLENTRLPEIQQNGLSEEESGGEAPPQAPPSATTQDMLPLEPTAHVSSEGEGLGAESEPFHMETQEPKGESYSSNYMYMYTCEPLHRLESQFHLYTYTCTCIYVNENTCTCKR